MVDVGGPAVLERRQLERVQIVAVLGLVLFAPAVLLVATVGFLLLAGATTLDGLTALELAELYLVELFVFAGFAYLLYRVVHRAVAVELPRLDDGTDGSEGPEATPTEDGG